MFFKVFAESLCNLFNSFWEDCISKSKLFLAASRVIYLNTEEVCQKFTVSGPLGRYSYSLE